MELGFRIYTVITEVSHSINTRHFKCPSCSEFISTLTRPQPVSRFLMYRRNLKLASRGRHNELSISQIVQVDQFIHIHSFASGANEADSGAGSKGRHFRN